MKTGLNKRFDSKSLFQSLLLQTSRASDCHDPPPHDPHDQKSCLGECKISRGDNASLVRAALYLGLILVLNFTKTTKVEGLLPLPQKSLRPLLCSFPHHVHANSSTQTFPFLRRLMPPQSPGCLLGSSFPLSWTFIS